MRELVENLREENEQLHGTVEKQEQKNEVNILSMSQFKVYQASEMNRSSDYSKFQQEINKLKSQLSMQIGMLSVFGAVRPEGDGDYGLGCGLYLEKNAHFPCGID